MKAKDTVMSDEEMEQFMVKLCANPALLLRLVEHIQAISFKAGREEKSVEAYHQGMEDGRKAVTNDLCPIIYFIDQELDKGKYKDLLLTVKAMIHDYIVGIKQGKEGK